MNKLLFIIVIFSLSCDRTQSKNVEVKVDRTLETALISSGSGLGAINDTVFIVGDDAEYIARFSVEDSSFRRMRLYPNAPLNRIDRSIKHDLESCVVWPVANNNFLVAFGSGGVSSFRDTLFAIHVNDTAQHFKRSLLSLYHAIKKKCGLEDNELNIEGAALTTDQLYLFNRGKNFLVSFDRSDFKNYLFEPDTTYTPPFKILNVSLPVVDGYPVGFSGACTLNEEELLFTASVEETSDFTKDGEIKGSYIGVLRLANDTAVTVKALHKLRDNSGNYVSDKLESIEIIGKGKGHIKAFAVADNDNGSSKLFELTIKLP